MIDLKHLRGKRYAVMGLAKSGLATARALADAGVEILAWDDGEAGRAAATAAGIPLTEAEGGKFAPATASDELAATGDRLQEELGEGPALDVG